jgi:hypothetical protein
MPYRVQINSVFRWRVGRTASAREDDVTQIAQGRAHTLQAAQTQAQAAVVRDRTERANETTIIYDEVFPD